jgi:arsenate reductase
VKGLLKVMKALGDATRVKIFKLLQRRPLCVCELTALLAISQSAVSKHLKLLDEAGLVASERQGPWVNYRLSAEGPCQAAVSGLMREWLEDDAGLQALLARAQGIDRLSLCAQEAAGRRGDVNGAAAGPPNPARRAAAKPAPPVTKGAGRVRVLFLCRHNSCRSQLAEGVINRLAGGRLEAASAGAEPTFVHPLAVRALAEIGVETGPLHSKGLSALAGQRFDYAVSLCAEAHGACAAIPGAARRVRLAFPDPSRAAGPEEERLAAFRRVRDAIKERLLTYFEAEGVLPPRGRQGAGEA